MTSYPLKGAKARLLISLEKELIHLINHDIIPRFIRNQDMMVALLNNEAPNIKLQAPNYEAGIPRCNGDAFLSSQQVIREVLPVIEEFKDGIA